jgi:FMN reductase
MLDESPGIAEQPMEHGPAHDPVVMVVVGNPQAASRTAALAVHVAQEIAEIVGPGTGVELVELAPLATELASWGDPAVAAVKEQVLRASTLVVASPTYKASFTGLVKLFLDQFAHGELGGLPTVPVMTGGSMQHALAVEVHLKPVLVEIGASCLTRGLFVGGPDVDAPDQAVAEWLAESRAVLQRVFMGA